MTTKKSRFWTFIVYPESVNTEWKEKLKMTGLSMAISPLHDMDYSADGQPKKPHYHVIAIWDGPTTYNTALGICNSIGATIPQAVNNIRGIYRYLTHQDDADKAQYQKSDIEHLNGFDVEEYLPLSKTDVKMKRNIIMQMIRQLGINEYCDLLEYLVDNGLHDEFDVACNNTYLFTQYIGSRRNKMKDIEKEKMKGELYDNK